MALFILPLFSCTDKSSENSEVDILTLRGAVFDKDNGSYSPTEMELNLDVRSSSFNADSHLFKVEGVEVFLSRLN